MIDILEKTAKRLVGPGKGILAADESTASANKRFAAVGIEETEDARRAYRDILLESPKAGEILSGVILAEETFWQDNLAGAPFRRSLAARGILPGIKVDEGLVDLLGFPGEKVTKGLDSLPERMAKYHENGAVFAKWRAVVSAEPGFPSDAALAANMFLLARYARVAQEYDIVPIVEPEVLLDGSHTIDASEVVLARTLQALFSALQAYRVHLPGVILKTSMVLPGKDAGVAMDNEEVGLRTARTLKAYVPKEVGGVVFLSGGQTSVDAMRNLAAVVRQGGFPWGLTFSYSRALQDPVLSYWAGHRDDRAGSQGLFDRQLDVAARALRGEDPIDKAVDFVSGSQDL